MGRIHQISVSDGGVPKLPVDGATVNSLGVVGDEQADRVHHGGPDRALCLFSLEVIERLQDEGHPIAAGSVGENITISGLDWASLTPGSRLRLGDQVEAEITSYTEPCAKNAQWFKDGKFGRIKESRHPGESRVYARVVTDGWITTGDEVQLVSQ